MRAISYSNLRRNLAAMMDQVHDDREPLLITRERGKPAAVLLSAEEFASYEATLHLLRSPRNAERLLRSIADAESGKLTERTLIE